MRHSDLGSVAALATHGRLPGHPAPWFWDGQEHVDPAKKPRPGHALAEPHDHLAYEYARQGRDWESELRQRAKEVALLNELGLAQAAPQAATTTQVPSDKDEQDQEDQVTQEEGV